MTSVSRFSIVITNYNYGRFLREAIESALDQSYTNVEVIVVDDASTDGSAEIIASYGDRVIPVLKDQNEGMAAAFNAGFARASGDVVLFLDADDVLLRDTAERIVTIFQAKPEVTNVHFRLEIMDSTGQPTGATLPPRHRILRSGDLRDLVLHAPDDVMLPPTTGNAFAHAILNVIFPIPQTYRRYAESYVVNLVPLFGPVHSLESVGGRYRVHERNESTFGPTAAHATATLDLEKLRDSLRAKVETHAHIRTVARSLGLPVPRDTRVVIPSVMSCAERIASLRLERDAHPIAGDTVWRAAVEGIAASRRNSEFTLGVKVLCAAWFALMYGAPKPAARWLAERFFFAPTRPNLNRVLSFVQRKPQSAPASTDSATRTPST